MVCDIDIAIIGAGVIGLAVACEVSRKDRSVYILEKNDSYGKETSSRNSGVIHSAILNPRGSWNAALCFEGNRLLYEFAQKYNVDHRKTGKLLSAIGAEEAAALEALYERRSEGLEMQLLTQNEMRAIEPEVNGEAGILLASPGVIDVYRLMQAYLGLARLNGAQMVLKSEVTGVEKLRDGFNLKIQESGCVSEIKSRVIINCAGLNSDKIAALAGIDTIKSGYRLSYFKGEYYSLNPVKSRHLRSRLIYPMIRPGGLVGIHTVLDLDGRVRLGPYFYPCDDLDYSIDDAKKQIFYEGASRLFSNIGCEDIEPESTGIMPRTYSMDRKFKDFIIRHEADRGLDGLINLVGIESPGVTASLAIGKYVNAIIADILGDRNTSA
jgi:L-2-hydroxyglutarate oxidase LhgO